MARPKSTGETATVSKPISFKPSEASRLEAYSRASGIPVATFVKRAAFEKLDAIAQLPSRAFAPVPVLGVIAAGQAIEVVPFSDVFTTPPLELRDGSYVLLVAGDSMEADEGLSIENGSYAVFNKDAPPPYGGPVHVEWEDTPGERVCTLKLYYPKGNDVEFRPLNPRHKTIKRKRDSFEIRGVYMENWKE